MIDLLKVLGGLLVGVFRSHAAREAEMAFLRQQLVVLKRSAPARRRLRTADRLIFVWHYRLFPSVLEAAVVVKPETLLRWHRSRIDLFVVPTIGFKLLYGLVILRLERRRLVWTDATPHPTAEWIARQITEAFPWDEAPRYLIRDRDTSYGTAVTRRLQAMGIRDRPIRPRSPWQNGHVERLIGSIRRECLDHVVVLGERHLRHSYLARRFPSALRSDGIIGRHR